MTTRATQVVHIAGPRQRCQVRSRRITLAAFIAVLLLALVGMQYAGLQRTSFTTGYSLFTAVLFLASLQIRKRLPGLPIGRVYTWLQIHIYVGYLSILLFGLHVGTNLPRGWLEIALYGIYVFVASSGIYGLYITRVVPSLLRSLPEEVIYEKIPSLRKQAANEARNIALEMGPRAATVAALYRDRLARFFERPRSIWYFVRPTGIVRRRLLALLREQHRYLDASQREQCAQLERLVAHKDDLDYHAALQGRLKLWLFAHVGFTYSLILLGAVHGLLAHAFGGSR